MQIVNGASIFHRVVTQFIGGTVAITGFHPPARHPHGEPIGVMVATNGSFPFLDGWRSAKFSSPEHQGFLHKPAGLEIEQ